MATSLGLGGCLVVNGAFQPVGDDASASASSSAVVTTGDPADPGTGPSGASETGSVETSDGAPTSGASTGGASTEAASSTGASSTGQDACAGEVGDPCVAEQIAGQTYLVCEQLWTWEEARLACEDRCARLVILDEAESAGLFGWLRTHMTDADIEQEEEGGDQVPMPRASWWIGGRKVDGDYVWLDGTPMPPKGTGGWYSDDPDMGGDDGCAALAVFGKDEGDGKWFDRRCDDVPYRAVCEPV